jgi:hypothetical protein
MSSLRVSDDDDVTIHMATANLPNPPKTLEEKREHMTAAHRLIHAKDAAGVPFFTNDLFRDVVRQLESNNSPYQRVSLICLDGLAVQFPIETGKEYQTYSSDDDCIYIM